MKRAGWIIGVLAFGAGLCLTVESTAALASDAGDIKKLEQGIATSAKARDLDSIMKNYPKGDTLFVFDVAPPRQYVGYEAFRKDWQNFLDSFSGPMTYDIEDIDVVTDGKLGYAHMVQHIAGHGKDGKPVEINVRVTDVLRKTSGRWQIIHEHASFPVDLSSGKADLLSKP